MLLGALALPVLACARGDDEAAPANEPSSTALRLGSRLIVFAASSLTDAFAAIGAAFERDAPGVHVASNFASSSALATQIEQGAPADVFASADAAPIERLARQGLLRAEPVIFARNVLVIVARTGGAPRVETPHDLARPGMRLVLAAPDVPVGVFARQAIGRLATDAAYGPGFERAVLANVVSQEPTVRAVLAKVELGEADAGIVYVTDARVAGERVRAIVIPDAANIVAHYPIAALRDASNPTAAAAFIAFVRGPVAQRILHEAGFLPGAA